jgi:pilus assembly protein CpaB
VLVTPEQAEILTLATNEGKIQLVLRNSKDDGVEKTPGSDGVKLFGRGSLGKQPRNEVEDPDAHLKRVRPAPFAAGTAAPPAPKTEEIDQIVMIRGTTRTVERVMKFSEPGSNP